MISKILFSLLFGNLALAATTVVAPRQVSPQPVPDGTLPKRWVYQGCWVDGDNGRILKYEQTGISGPMTVESCAAECQRLNYQVGGVQYGHECWCSDKVVNAGRLAASDEECNMSCEGASNEACGGSLRLSIYSEYEPIVIPVPTVKTITEPSWEYRGCYKDTDERIFPDFYRFYYTSTDPKFCVNRCAEEGFHALGAEYGSECWCGTLEQFALAEETTEDECWSICLGDEASLCGGPMRMTVYTRTAGQ